MKADETFIKKLEMYFDEDFNDYTKKRISVYLKEYREDLPPIVIKTKEYVSEAPRQTREEGRRRLSISDEDLYIQARIFSEENNISINELMSKTHTIPKRDIIQYRKKFCNYIVENFKCSNNQLADFFDVDHSTISYYLYGKRHRKLPKNNNVVQNKL